MSGNYDLAQHKLCHQKKKVKKNDNRSAIYTRGGKGKVS